MNVVFAYYKQSGLSSDGILSLAPNLSREPVSFDAELREPLRFREAISALHDVVINDLRFKPRDKSAYEAYKQAEQRRLANIRTTEYKAAAEAILARRAADVPRDLESRFEKHRRTYWDARLKYSNYLARHDQELWRLLMPCDPIITVADDVCFFECFSADESSYGCLTVDRDSAFGPSAATKLGTTNVDYSWNLYHQFQKLRTYRDTRFRVDPQGFEVAVQGSADYREEKIDLPNGWLRGLMQVQSAMALPMRRVSLSRDAVYSLLLWLRRHKAARSPRGLRFEMLPGAAPRIVVEPWEQAIVAHGVKYEGPSGPPIRIWGRQRLLVLARLLPLVDRFDVYLLGTGLPSFWVAHMGNMRLTLGLSGWTTNDWTRGSALDLLAPPVKISQESIARVDGCLRERRAATLPDIAAAAMLSPAECAAALNRLAHTGQAIYDLSAGLYRRRQIMPQILGEAQLGPENVEAAEARKLMLRRTVVVESRQPIPGGSTLFTGQVERSPVELLVDADGLMKRGKCKCSHHFKGGLRMGPCRHLLALRDTALSSDPATQSLDAWYERLLRGAAN